ncbi:MAG: redoxin domain-containing protein [Flavobacterium sp.]|uniref:redoxin domain-containing protein n=1 Tax=Flavobacterium sp. TaxID=239 RepID=UPI003BDCF8E8
MKKTLFLVTTAIVLFSCKNLAEGEYEITGNIKGIKSGLVYLEKQDPMGMGVKTIDTVKIIDGKFEIKGKTTEPEICFIQIDKVNGKVPFILEGGEIEMQVDKDSLFKSKLSGTYSNDEFSKFNEETNKLQKKVQKKAMDFQMKNMAKMNEAQKNKDTVAMNSLRKQYELIQKDITDYTFDYPKTHSKSYISVLIVQAMFNNSQFKVKEIETVYNSLDESLKKTKPGKKVKENIDNLKKQMNAKAKIAVGIVAPDFKAPTPDGKLVSLKESLGKVTLIDFWASWCQPCRQENPSVVALYAELHSKGLNIISVSLDNDATKWKEAIAKDKLTWTNVSNLKQMKDPIAEQYGIQQIPTTFLLDATGKIVAIDLRGDGLKAKINELLASK